MKLSCKMNLGLSYSLSYDVFNAFVREDVACEGHSEMKIIF